MAQGKRRYDIILTENSSEDSSEDFEQTPQLRNYQDSN